MNTAMSKPPPKAVKKWTPPQTLLQKKKAKAPPPPPPPPKINFDSLAIDANQFSEECDKFLRASTPINSVYSPFFIRNILAMLRLGAGDLSAYELDRCIKISTPPTDNLITFAELLAKLMVSLQELNRGGSSLTAVDRIYIKSGFEVTSSFSRALQDLFQTQIGSINFNQPDEALEAINWWFQEATQHRISRILEPNELNLFGDHTRLVLLSAIHFEGEWKNKFMKRRTHQAPFYINDKKTIDCTMMVNKAPVLYAYVKKIGCHAVGLPFMDGHLIMIIISSRIEPTDPTYNSNTYRYNLHDFNMNELVSQMEEGNIEIHLPRFSLESTTHFIQPLKHLGMRTIFDPTSANFSGITGYDMDGLYISDIVQKVIVEFTDTPDPPRDPTIKKKGVRTIPPFRPFNSGTTRAVKTKKKPKSVTMDHPFVFHIIDKMNSNLILFSGLCSNPNLRTIETQSPSKRSFHPRPVKYNGFSLRIDQELRKANIC